MQMILLCHLQRPFIKRFVPFHFTFCRSKFAVQINTITAQIYILFPPLYKRFCLLQRFFSGTLQKHFTWTVQQKIPLQTPQGLMLLPRPLIVNHRPRRLNKGHVNRICIGNKIHNSCNTKWLKISPQKFIFHITTAEPRGLKLYPLHATCFCRSGLAIRWVKQFKRSKNGVYRSLRSRYQ